MVLKLLIAIKIHTREKIDDLLITKKAAIIQSRKYRMCKNIFRKIQLCSKFLLLIA